MKRSKNRRRLVPKKVYDRWSMLYEFGDITKLVKATGYGRSTIERAINRGNGSPDVIRAINAYFASKTALGKVDEALFEKELLQVFDYAP